MKKVITYGTFDLLHHGHIKILERAKALGDYLIVGVTADDYDKSRGKINVQQTLIERVLGVKETGLADEIIVEEYEGQKIDDIIKHDVDIFTVGSDWEGVFDYLNQYCKVVYLQRTEGVSSSQIREGKASLKMGLVGETRFMKKYYNESAFINGLKIQTVYTLDKDVYNGKEKKTLSFSKSYDELLNKVDAVYIASHPSKHYEHILQALENGKHVLCESPIAMTAKETKKLLELAQKKGLILMDAIKTAYSTAYNRLLLLLKSGKIGKVVSVDTTCTSIEKIVKDEQLGYAKVWNSICAWGPTAMLPVFQVLGTDVKNLDISSVKFDDDETIDLFTKVNFTFKDAVASIKVGKGVKAEGELIISGTKGYIYVPAPWWKTDYFEVRYENANENVRYFNQLDGEGIRHQLLAFVRAVKQGNTKTYVDQETSIAISKVIEKYNNGQLNQLK